MVRFIMLILVTNFMIYAQPLVLKKQRHQPSLNQLREQLCEECAVTIKISPKCIKKIAEHDLKEGGLLLKVIADVQSMLIKILDEYWQQLDGFCKRAKKEELENSISDIRSIKSCLEQCSLSDDPTLLYQALKEKVQPLQAKLS